MNNDINPDLAARSHDLLVQQKQEWEMLRSGYASLEKVQTRTLEFDGFNINLQFNPGRIVSSAAKVDPKSIADRKCFLCHLPPVQRGVAFGDDYTVLCNPFPIFPEHFTIPHKQHTPQRIASSFGAMIDLARAMQSRYTIFYNGPKCGASAPDHLHFQAGDKDFMLIDREYDAVAKRWGKTLHESPKLKVVSVGTEYLRPFIAIESSDRDEALRAFGAIHDAINAIAPNDEEPMMNILASSNSNRWRIIVIPRAKHRPSFYFAEGDAKILLSPASVDLGGVCITPIERDFHRVTKDHIVQMCDEVCLSRTALDSLIRNLAATINS